MAQGCSVGTRDGKGIAPGIVGVFYYLEAGGVHQGNDVPLEVGYVIEGSRVVGKGQGAAVGIVSKLLAQMRMHLCF